MRRRLHAKYPPIKIANGLRPVWKRASLPEASYRLLLPLGVADLLPGIAIGSRK